MSGRAYISVLDRDGKPLMPCTAKRARLLLTRRRARVLRMQPFVIQMKDRSESDCEFQPMTVKLDPGSKKTGICVARISAPKQISVCRLMDLEHRSLAIKKKLTQRAMLRRNRRSRKTRYRPSRFLNRTKPKGWLAPSLKSRVDSTLAWVKRLCRWYPVSELAVERVRFDMQKMQNADINGIEYQQGELYGYEVREYLLEKWNRTCAYCGTTTSSRLEVEHVIPRSKNGSGRISNLVLACHDCNQRKGNLPIEEFLKHDQSRLKLILNQLKTGLRDVGAVNSTRNKLFSELLKLGLPVEAGTGGQTKYNRIRLNIPKTHASDAACVGEVEEVKNWLTRILHVKCTGRGRYSRTLMNKFGNPRAFLMKTKRVFGFQSGDLVEITKQKTFEKFFVYIIVRSRGVFQAIKNGFAFEFSWRICRKIQSHDGYTYHYGPQT